MSPYEVKIALPPTEASLTATDTTQEWEATEVKVFLEEQPTYSLLDAYKSRSLKIPGIKPMIQEVLEIRRENQ